MRKKFVFLIKTLSGAFREYKIKTKICPQNVNAPAVQVVQGVASSRGPRTSWRMREPEKVRFRMITVGSRRGRLKAPHNCCFNPPGEEI